jgi:two-component system sensor histidine kinase BarA
MESHKESPAIDWSMCLKLAADKPNLAEEMLSIFTAELPGATQSIIKAHKIKDQEKFHMLVHKLHGASCYCGVPRLKAILMQLESKIKSHEESAIEGLLTQLEKEVSLVLATYEKQNFKDV